jgi:hypothetical protein
MTDVIPPELEPKYHSDVTKKLYTEARRNTAKKAISLTQNFITEEAQKGKANILIDLSNYKLDIPTVAEYLTSEYYNIQILPAHSILVNLDSNKTTPVNNIKLKITTDINYTDSIFGIGLPTYAIFLLAFMIIGSGTWGCEEKSPNWPIWYKVSLLYIPFIFSAIGHLLYNHDKYKTTKLIFENNPNAMKWYLYEQEGNSHHPLHKMTENTTT